MSSTFGELGDIADGFAAAAIDPTRWNAAMESAARATGSSGAILVPLKGRLPLFPHNESLQPVVESYVKDGWIDRDVRYRPMATLLQKRVATEFDFTSPDEMAHLPYYQEFLRPHKLQWYAAVIIGERDNTWSLSLQRSIAQGPFTPSELRRLSALSRSLSGAAELARAFNFARLDGALQAFETSGSAVAMIGRFGQVVSLNRSAERLLGTDLQVVHGHIVSADRDATAALRRALHALIWSREADVMQPPIVLPRKDGRPILAYPSRLTGGVAADGFAQCHGFVLFVDLEARLGIPPGDLAQVFGLTSAEARLVNRLLNEDSVEAAADQLGVARETARNQLKSVFQKTETHRQGQLISLLTRLKSAYRQRLAERG